MTSDLDLIVALDEENITNIITCFNTQQFTPSLPVDPHQLANPKVRDSWVTSKNMVAFPFRHSEKSYIVVDILIDSPIPFDTLYKNKHTVNSQTTHIDVVSLDDLISLKKHSNRKQDQCDIESLQKIKGTS